MEPAANDDVNQVDVRLSQDMLAHLVVWIILISVGMYSVMARSLHGSDAIKLGIVLGVVALQSASRFLPVTKNWKTFNSGGTGALLLYNIAVVLLFLWFIPLYSPFLLIFPAVMFITIYYRGMEGFLMAAFFVILIAVIYTVQFGTPHVPFGRYFPYLTIALGVAYGLTVQRISYFDSKIRAEFHKASNKVQLEREQLNSLINSMADAVIAIDRSGVILFYNGAAANLVDTNTNLVGQPFVKYFSIYDKAQNTVDLLGQARRENRNFQTTDYRFVTGDHEQINLFIDIAPIRSTYTNQQAQNGFIILMRDITKQKTLDEERDEFISVTSHELRTPIAVAEANLSMALKTSAKIIDADAAKRLQLAYNNVTFLAELINDLSTLSRAENKGLHVPMESVKPKELVAEVGDQYREDITKKGLQLQVNIAEDVQPIVSSTLYIREILQNLMTNAIKYTNEGSVSLSVQNGPGQSVIFSVKDTGIGIGTSDKAKIFNKYYRSEDYRTRETRGTGLGLYITYRLTEYLRGKVWLDSELNKGSTFYVQVPSRQATAPSSTNTPVDTPTAVVPAGNQTTGLSGSNSAEL